MRVVLAACCDKDSEGVDVFSLNHDTVVESALSKGGVNYMDGFTRQSKMRQWEPSLFDAGSFRCRLFKLHGSVNWFRFKRHRGNLTEYFAGIAEGPGDFWHPEDNDGRRLDMPDGRPLLLVGTFNKMLAYLSGVFTELFFRFYRELFASDRLVIAGYGFGDKGINTRIIEWAYSGSHRRIVLIDPNMAELKEKARPAFQRCWKEMVQAGRLTEISAGVESVDWPEIKKASAV